MVTNIFLIGPMGAGKTTVGRYVAKELAFDFYDSDQYIEEQTGAKIAWIFDLEGEGGFRDREEQIIATLTDMQNIVLATGGGAVLSSKNRELLKSRGKVIYLHVSIKQQLKRIGHSKDRPLLADKKNIKQTLEAMIIKREPIYRELADVIIDTDHINPKAVAEQILESLKN